MTNSNLSGLLSLWQANTLRLTAFTAREAVLDSSNWWINVVGKPPDTESRQLKMHGLRQGGEFEKGELNLELEPGRIDWKYLPAEAKQDTTLPDSDIIPSIGPFREAIDSFRQLMMRWFSLETCPSTTRLAFGSVLLLPVTNRESGYRQLATYLPFLDLDPEHTSDLLYRINRRRFSVLGIQGLHINRLSKWSVGTFQRQVLAVGTQGVQYATSGPLAYACNLELDINTAQEFTDILEHNKLAGIFNELIELGMEIVVKGDVR